jgi:hypothetical protein
MKKLPIYKITINDENNILIYLDKLNKIEKNKFPTRLVTINGIELEELSNEIRKLINDGYNINNIELSTCDNLYSIDASK